MIRAVCCRGFSLTQAVRVILNMAVLGSLFFVACAHSHGFQLKSGEIGSVNNPEAKLPTDLDLLQERRASLRRLADPKYFMTDLSYWRAHDILAGTALQGCGNEEWKSFMVNLPNKGTDHEPTEMFSLVALVRYLFQFGGCLTEQQKAQLQKNLSKPQYLLGHGTTNQAIVQASSWYLLAQFFSQNTWIDVQTKKVYSSAQLMATLKPLLVARTKRIFASGHHEWLSTNYATLNIYPLLNLIDFAQDSEIKANANDEAILEVAILRTSSFHGVVVPPFTRKNADQRNGRDSPENYFPSISQLTLWYYFGEPHGLGVYDFHSGTQPFYISMLGISSWLPPIEVLAMKLPDSTVTDQSVKIVTPRFALWGNPADPQIFGDSWITDEFSVATGNILFDPSEYNAHVQTFSILLRSTKPHNEIECYQPFWHSNAGEDAWLVDRSSPFQQMYRYDDSSVVMLFDIPKVDPWKFDASNRWWLERDQHADSLLQLVTCRFALDFDEIIQEKNWVFVRQGEVFAAMATLKGSNEYDSAGGGLLRHFKVVKIHEPKTALFFRVDKKSPDFNFAQFQKSVRNKLPVYDPKTSTIALTEKNGTKTKVTFELKPIIKGAYWSALPRVVRDGQLMKYDSSFVVQAPGLTLRDGILTIKSDAGELKLNH